MSTTFRLLPISLLLIIFLAGFTPGKQPRILVFSKTAGYYHESIPVGIAAVQKLGSENGFLVDTTKNATLLNAKNLKKYDAVVFLNTSQDVLNEEQQTAFEAFIEQGGGYVGLHAAADTEYDWAWYGKLVGAYFNGHPNDPNVRTAVLHPVDTTHIASAHLPADWSRADEWYNYKDIQTDLNVLVLLDETTYEGGINGDVHPIAWCHAVGKGRAFYTGGGHTAEAYGEPHFQKHLLGGIMYAIGK